MKGALIGILLLILCMSVGSVSASNIGASIADQDFPSGNWHRGETQCDANVWIKNTGDLGHQFWISYSVMDRRGQWYTAPPVSVWADPGDSSTWFANPRWYIPYDAMLSSYQAEFAVYGYYDSNTGQLYDLLDQVDQPNAFTVVG